jgi:homoserine dehydrogenase
MNAVILEGNPVGESVLQGEGAGPGPTSSALMSDLLSILRGNIKYPFGISDNRRKKVKIYDMNKYSNSLYLRLEVKDKPGVLSIITRQLAKFNISVQRLIQIPDNKRKTASIVIITHEANELNSKKCLKSLKVNSNILKAPVLIRLF